MHNFRFFPMHSGRSIHLLPPQGIESDASDARKGQSLDAFISYTAHLMREAHASSKCVCMVLDSIGANGGLYRGLPMSASLRMFLRCFFLITAVGGTEGTDENFTVLGHFQRIPHNSISSQQIDMKPS